MKMRAPGSQPTAQTARMLSLPIPKLGACKFAPVLRCWWGQVALLAERRFGVWLWTQHMDWTELGAWPAGYDGDGAGLPAAELAGMLPKRELLGLGGGICLVQGRGKCRASLAAAPGVPHAPRYSQPGYILPPPPLNTEGGWDLAASLGRLFSHTAVICSLCSFGLWYQGSSKDPSTSSCSGAWEIIDSLDTQLELEGERESAAGSTDRAMQPL